MNITCSILDGTVLTFALSPIEQRAYYQQKVA